MTNGIKPFREKLGISKSDLARRAGIGRQQLGRLEDGKRVLSAKWAEKIAPVLGCTPADLMFPELDNVDTSRFRNVFEIANSDEKRPESPGLAIEPEFLARMLPNASGHNLRFMMVDAYQAGGLVAKGDALVIDMEDNEPTRPGLYALDIAGVLQWRYLSPTITGTIQVHGDNPASIAETVKAEDLKVIGRARLRISTL